MIAPTEPAYYPFDCIRFPDILDIGITNSNTFYSNPVIELDSNHIPVLITSQQLAPPHAPTPKTNTQRVNWNTFQNLINKAIPKIHTLNSPIEIEHSMSYFNTVIYISIQEAEGDAQQTLKKHKHKKLPDEIQKAIFVKNSTRRLWAQKRTPELKEELNLITHIVKKIIKTHNNGQYQKLVQSLNSKDNSIWQFTKKYLKRR